MLLGFGGARDRKAGRRREGSVGSVNEMATWGRGVWGSRGPERVVGWEIGGWYEWTRVMIWRMGETVGGDRYG